MGQPLFDEADKVKIKRYLLISVFVAIFVAVGVMLVINATATDDDAKQENTAEIIELLEND